MEKIKKFLKEFNVKSEDELLNKLDEEAQTIPCIVCGKELKFEKIHWNDSDPFCGDCFSEL
jgi:hypothetical protein